MQQLLYAAVVEYTFVYLLLSLLISQWWTSYTPYSKHIIFLFFNHLYSFIFSNKLQFILFILPHHPTKYTFMSKVELYTQLHPTQIL